MMTVTIKPRKNYAVLYAFVFLVTDVGNLVKLMRTVNFKLLLDLNLQLRYGTQWDPTNTANFLGYVNRMKYHDVFNFELGNGKIFSSEMHIEWNIYQLLDNAANCFP